MTGSGNPRRRQALAIRDRLGLQSRMVEEIAIAGHDCLCARLTGKRRQIVVDIGEVEAGLECGITLDGYQDVKVGDVLEAFETKQVEKTLE